jgi:hypothetical protein
VTQATQQLVVRSAEKNWKTGEWFQPKILPSILNSPQTELLVHARIVPSLSSDFGPKEVVAGAKRLTLILGFTLKGNAAETQVLLSTVFVEGNVPNT